MKLNKFAFGTPYFHTYRIYYVNVNLRHQYGISVAESQTFLPCETSPATSSEEKRLFPQAVQNRGAGLGTVMQLNHNFL